MLGSAIGCGILLGVFEGVGVLVGRCVAFARRLQFCLGQTDRSCVLSHRLFAETNKPISPLVSLKCCRFDVRLYTMAYSRPLDSCRNNRHLLPVLSSRNSHPPRAM